MQIRLVKLYQCFAWEISLNLTKRKFLCGSLIQAYLPVLDLDFITYTNFCWGLVEGSSACIDSTGYDNEVQVDYELGSFLHCQLFCL